MERLFVRDLDQAEEIEAEAWGRRGAGRRLMEWLARLWEYWL
jgi:cardiolipin synthase